MAWYRILYLSLSVFLILSSCQQENCDTSLSFYHWKTQYAPDSLEQAYLQTLSSERLYLRLFDVDWDPARQEPTPKAEARINAQLPHTIVPTIYITNRTLLQASTIQLETLVQQILDKVASYLPLDSIPELQIDCDWTGRSQAAYFDLLNGLKAELPTSTALSATLRLHQYRWPEKTGVPPVDRGMLMFYNMGDLDDWTEPNSILNLDKAQAYLQHTNEYPLPLDIALPLFHWGVLYRQGQMIKLINKLSREELEAVGAVATDEQHLRFRILESTYLQGYYLYTGDEIRLEEVSPQDLREAAKLLRPLPCSQRRYLAFYHLDSDLLPIFPPDSLRRVQQELDQETEYE